LKIAVLGEGLQGKIKSATEIRFIVAKMLGHETVNARCLVRVRPVIQHAAKFSDGAPDASAWDKAVPMRTPLCEYLEPREFPDDKTGPESQSQFGSRLSGTGQFGVCSGPQYLIHFKTVAPVNKEELIGIHS